MVSTVKMSQGVMVSKTPWSRVWSEEKGVGVEGVMARSRHWTHAPSKPGSGPSGPRKSIRWSASTGLPREDILRHLQAEGELPELAVLKKATTKHMALRGSCRRQFIAYYKACDAPRMPSIMAMSQQGVVSTGRAVSTVEMS